MGLNESYQQFAAVLEDVGGKWAVHVVGEVDLSCASELEAAIDKAASFGTSVIIDLMQCRYMDSTGLTAIVRAVKNYGARIEAVVMETSPISRVMRMAGFQNILPISFVTSAVPSLSMRRL